MLIIRRSDCINTASGTVFSVSDRPVCRLKGETVRSQPGTGRSLTVNTVPDAVLIQFDLLMMSTQLLETCVEAYNNRSIIYRNCASSWSFTESYQQNQQNKQKIVTDVSTNYNFINLHHLFVSPF